MTNLAFDLFSPNSVEKKADQVVEANGVVNSIFDYGNQYSKIKQDVVVHKKDKDDYIEY